MIYPILADGHQVGEIDLDPPLNDHHIRQVLKDFAKTHMLHSAAGLKLLVKGEAQNGL